MSKKPTQSEDIQEVYLRMQENKKLLKSKKEFLKEQYLKNEEFKNLEEKTRETNSKKKLIKYAIDAENKDICDDIADIKIDIAGDKEKINDYFITELAEGHMPEIEDQYQQMVIPIFSVSLRRKEI